MQDIGVPTLVQPYIRDPWREARNPGVHIRQRIGVKRDLNVRV